MSSLRDLENETAETILNTIKEMASGMGVASGVLDLANAYAAVVAAAPGPKPAGPRMG